jgi:hypothetical protein
MRVHWIQLAYHDKFQRPAVVNMAIKFYVAEKREFLDEVTED